MSSNKYQMRKGKKNVKRETYTPGTPIRKLEKESGRVFEIWWKKCNIEKLSWDWIKWRVLLIRICMYLDFSSSVQWCSCCRYAEQKRLKKKYIFHYVFIWTERKIWTASTTTTSIEIAKRAYWRLLIVKIHRDDCALYNFH